MEGQGVTSGLYRKYTITWSVAVEADRVDRRGTTDFLSRRIKVVQLPYPALLHFTGTGAHRSCKTTALD